MAGGALIVVVDDYGKLQAVAQQVLCWAGAANVPAVQVQHTPGGNRFAIRVPEESFGAGALALKRGGTNLVAGYVAGSVVVYDAANGQALSRDVPPTCPATTNQPTTTGTPPVVLNVGGNPRTITLNYANVGAAGTVNIYWGDGTSSLAQAESGAINHTYPDVGSWKIRIEDVSVPTDFATFVIKI